MREPDKAELRAFDEHGTVPARRATVVCFQRAENATYKAVVSLTEDRVESFDHVPGVQSNFTVDEFVECDQLLRTQSRAARRPRQARHRRHRSGVLRHLDLRRRRRSCRVPRPQARMVGYLAQGRARHEPVCAPDQRVALRHRRQRHGGAAGRGRRARRHSRRHGGVRAEARPGPDPCGIAARTAQTPAHHSARRPVVHARRQSAAVAELVVADRLQLPRGHDAAHRAISGRRPQSFGGAPDVVRRDGGALPRLVRRPLPPHGVRHRGVGPRLHDAVAGTRLRLPRRDPVPRRGAARQRG